MQGTTNMEMTSITVTRTLVREVGIHMLAAAAHTRTVVVENEGGSKVNKMCFVLCHRA